MNIPFIHEAHRRFIVEISDPGMKDRPVVEFSDFVALDAFLSKESTSGATYKDYRCYWIFVQDLSSKEKHPFCMLYRFTGYHMLLPSNVDRYFAKNEPDSAL